MNNSQYTVSNVLKNAPIPAKARKSSKPSTNPIVNRLQSLQIGNSFIIEGAKMRDIHPMVYAAGKRLGIELLFRTVERGVAVWRIEKSAKTGRNAQSKAA